MNHSTHLLVGSLSNDLLRLSTFIYNQSPSAKRFLTEAKRWSKQLEHAALPPYLKKIVQDISQVPHTTPTLADAEKYLMYSILLQNYTLHS